MSYEGPSIVDYLRSVGREHSFGARTLLARELGIARYAGTAAQNTKLLRMLRGEVLASHIAVRKDRHGDNATSSSVGIAENMQTNNMRQTNEEPLAAHNETERRIDDDHHRVSTTLDQTERADRWGLLGQSYGATVNFLNSGIPDNAIRNGYVRLIGRDGAVIVVPAVNTDLIARNMMAGNGYEIDLQPPSDLNPMHTTAFGKNIPEEYVKGYVAGKGYVSSARNEGKRYAGLDGFGNLAIPASALSNGRVRLVGKSGAVLVLKAFDEQPIYNSMRSREEYKIDRTPPSDLSAPLEESSVKIVAQRLSQISPSEEIQKKESVKKNALETNVVATSTSSQTTNATTTQSFTTKSGAEPSFREKIFGTIVSASQGIESFAKTMVDSASRLTSVAIHSLMNALRAVASLVPHSRIFSTVFSDIQNALNRIESSTLAVGRGIARGVIGYGLALVVGVAAIALVPGDVGKGITSFANKTRGYVSELQNKKGIALKIGAIANDIEKKATAWNQGTDVEEKSKQLTEVALNVVPIAGETADIAKTASAFADRGVSALAEHADAISEAMGARPLIPIAVSDAGPSFAYGAVENPILRVPHIGHTGIADGRVAGAFSQSGGFSPKELALYALKSAIGNRGGTRMIQPLPVSLRAIRKVQDIAGFTEHGLDQIINRGVKPNMIRDAVTNPTAYAKRIDSLGRVSFRYNGPKAVLNFNKRNALITSWLKK